MADPGLSCGEGGDYMFIGERPLGGLEGIAYHQKEREVHLSSGQFLKYGYKIVSCNNLLSKDWDWDLSTPGAQIMVVCLSNHVYDVSSFFLYKISKLDPPLGLLPLSVGHKVPVQ